MFPDFSKTIEDMNKNPHLLRTYLVGIIHAKPKYSFLLLLVALEKKLLHFLRLWVFPWKKNSKKLKSVFFQILLTETGPNLFFGLSSCQYKFLPIFNRFHQVLLVLAHWNCPKMGYFGGYLTLPPTPARLMWFLKYYLELYYDVKNIQF